MILLTGAALAAASLWADTMPLSGAASSPATVTAAATPAVLGRGGSGRLIITLAVGPHYVVTAHQERGPDAIVATFTPQALAGVGYGAPQYPAARKVSIGGASELVYTGRVRIVVPFTLTPAAKARRVRVGGTLSYQGCSQANGTCLPPRADAAGAFVAIK